MGKNTLLIEYLERVSGRIMEDYPESVRGMMRGRSGVYALYRKDRLYYAGLASNLMGRIKAHLRDRHKGLWDRFSVYLTPDDHYMRELEALLLRIARPGGNKVSGRLRGATDLHSQLFRQMAQRDSERRAELLGGSIAKKLRRAKLRIRRGRAKLAGLLSARLPLRARYKGKLYKATFRKDGTVRYKNRSYLSPSAAASAVVGGNANGWRFWSYRTEKGWVVLDNYRR
jgi:hypothetical protein